MDTAAFPALFAHPLASAWLGFDLLPSRQVHPSALPGLLPAPLATWLLDAATPREAARLHRHWSRAMLRVASPEMPGQGPLVRLAGGDDPVLPLAMAPAPVFDRLLLGSGLVVLGPAIRRVIGHDEVALLESALGAWGLQFARGAASRLWAGGAADPPGPVLALQAHAQAQALGTALLALAFDAAVAPVASRARLRLPAPLPDETAPTELPLVFNSPAAALGLARSVLQEIEPAWLSLFPAPR